MNMNICITIEYGNHYHDKDSGSFDAIACTYITYTYITMRRRAAASSAFTRILILYLSRCDYLLLDCREMVDVFPPDYLEALPLFSLLLPILPFVLPLIRLGRVLGRVPSLELKPRSSERTEPTRGPLWHPALECSTVEQRRRHHLEKTLWRELRECVRGELAPAASRASAPHERAPVGRGGEARLAAYDPHRVPCARQRNVQPALVAHEADPTATAHARVEDDLALLGENRRAG